MISFSVPTISKTDPKIPDYKSRTLEATLLFLSHCHLKTFLSEVV